MRTQDLMLIILVVFIWGFNFVVIKVGLHEIPPLMLCAVRFFLTGIPAIFFFKRPAIPLKILISYGLTMFGMQFGFLFAGIYAGVYPGLAAILIQTQVFFTAILAALFLNERIHLWQIVGLIIAFSGILLIGEKLQGSVSLLGFVFIILAGLSWGTGNLIAKTIRSANMLALVIWGNFIAFVPTFFFAYLFEGRAAILTSLHHFNLLTLLAVLYLAYLSTMVGYGVWCRLLKMYPVTTVTPYALLVPIIGLSCSALILGEPLQSWKIIAGLLVISGLCINFFGSRWLSKNWTNERAGLTNS